MNDSASKLSGPVFDYITLSAEVIAQLHVGRDARPRALWRRVPGLLVFLVLFTRELVLANIAMAKVVIFQKPETLKPEFFIYDITGLKPGEIVILTHCISLTPGTTSVEVSNDETCLLVHGLDVSDAAEISLGIKKTLERPLLGWTR